MTDPIHMDSILQLRFIFLIKKILFTRTAAKRNIPLYKLIIRRALLVVVVLLSDVAGQAVLFKEICTFIHFCIAFIVFLFFLALLPCSLMILALLYKLSYGRREHEEMGSRSAGLVTDMLVINQGRPKLWQWGDAWGVQRFKCLFKSQ